MSTGKNYCMRIIDSHISFRSANATHHTVKSIHNPKSVLIMGFHMVDNCLRGCKNLRVDESIAIKQHHRNLCDIGIKPDTCDKESLKS